jgi:glycosyltransferase involved in cell wall biosynthesis
MAAIPFLVFGPTTILSTIGLLLGKDKSIPTPAKDWREATVDVVIPALNEEQTIILCLASVARQTFKPTRIILVDDGSNDRTVELAKEFAKDIGLEVLIIERDHPIGKTPTLKRQSREFDSDVEFILDADTILESDNYIERVVQELYQGAGIASACGTVLPLNPKIRAKQMQSPKTKHFLKGRDIDLKYPDYALFSRLQHLITDWYREILYFYLQKFIYLGEMTFFGGIVNPVGCAVAYRRNVLKEVVFDKYEPVLGDDLTNSEDIFIGFTFLDYGYRNIQVMDVYARSQEPLILSLPSQQYLWSSAFLQSCFYFKDLVKTPFRLFKQYKKSQFMKTPEGLKVVEKRKIVEAYRQSFGTQITEKYGRPIGWVIFLGLIEKITFPLILITMIAMKLWEPLIITIAAESTFTICVLVYLAKGHRIEYFFKALITTPIRYALVLVDAYTILRFLADIFIFKNRGWRK